MNAKLAARSRRILARSTMLRWRLGAEEIAPPEHVWVSLRNQLEAEGIIHDPQPAPQRESISHGWWIAFQRPALAGAFLALILVAATAISYQAGFLANGDAFAAGAAEQETSAVPSAESVFKEELLTVGNDSIPDFPEAGRRSNRFHPPEPRNC